MNRTKLVKLFCFEVLINTGSVHSVRNLIRDRVQSEGWGNLLNYKLTVLFICNSVAYLFTAEQ